MQSSGTPEELLTALRESSSRNWALFCHLSAFLSFFVPFGHLIGPVAVWLSKREENEFIDWHGREAVNFQITSTIVTVALAVLLFVLLLTGGVFAAAQLDLRALGSTLILAGCVLALLLAWGVTAFIFVLVAGVRASHGQRWSYPLCIRFLS